MQCTLAIFLSELSCVCWLGVDHKNKEPCLPQRMCLFILTFPFVEGRFRESGCRVLKAYPAVGWSFCDFWYGWSRRLNLCARVDERPAVVGSAPLLCTEYLQRHRDRFESPLGGSKRLRECPLTLPTTRHPSRVYPYPLTSEATLLCSFTSVSSNGHCGL